MFLFIIILLIIALLLLNYLTYLDLVESGTLDMLHKYKKHGELFFIISVPFGACFFTLWMVWRHRINTP